MTIFPAAFYTFVLTPSHSFLTISDDWLHRLRTGWLEVCTRYARHLWSQLCYLLRINWCRKTEVCRVVDGPLCGESWQWAGWQFRQTIRVTRWMTAEENHSGCSVRSRLPAQMPSLPLHYSALQVWMGVQNNIRKQHEIWHPSICMCALHAQLYLSMSSFSWTIPSGRRAW